MRSSRVPSISPPRTAPRSARWSERVPTIVAEALVAPADPLGAVLDPGAPRPCAEVAAALAALLEPEQAPDDAPPWLRAEQRTSFRRVLAALRRHGAACLADPVGSGKTWVALAVAAALEPRQPATCLVPAALCAQWERVAARVGVRVVVWSHERASRGRLPPTRRGLAIVDESHRFRSPGTRRYRTVAPWLRGRRVLLVSATPIVNRPDDLVHQLLLGARDDVLRAAGLPSLDEALRGGGRHPALARLVITGAPPAAMPARSSVAVRWRPSPTLRELLAGIDRLRLSALHPLAALVRGVLHRAAASSPAAAAGALRRYRALLAHARDAAAAGRTTTRADVLRATLGAWDQLVLWELLPGGEGPAELVLDDLAPLESLARLAAEACRRSDPKAERLRAVVADGRPTLVFTWAQETVRHLRDALGPATAWVTGTRAGIGATPLPRDAVLAWLAPGARRALPPGLRAPTVVVATEVAAEGLDLQGAGRVVHYDLPWTPTRLEQREGRAVRLGASREVVELVTFVPPRAVERRLGQAGAIARKARLPERAVLGEDGRRLRRVLDEVAQCPERSRPVPAGEASGIAACDAGPRGVLLGYVLGEGAPGGVVWFGADGSAAEDVGTIAARLASASSARDLPLGGRTRRAAIARASRFLQRRLRAALGDGWAVREAPAAARALLVRLRTLARDAARSRDARRLALADRGLRFVTRPHTAGEAALVAALADAPDAELERRLARLPADESEPATLWPRVAGIVVCLGNDRVLGASEAPRRSAGRGAPA
jgi:superfamily II DNA or RNA helicase